MKFILRCFFLAIVVLNSSCQESGVESNINTHIFYKNYTVNVPTDDYVIISMRGFGPGNYLVLDMSVKNLRIYSPYESEGLLSRRELKNEEITSILAIFESKEYMMVSETNMKLALDAEEVDIISKIKNRKKHIRHIAPDNKTIKNIINLYNELNIVAVF